MLFWIVLYSIPVLAASNETTSPPVGWQASPGRRGTWNIIENCLTTVFACTWSIQHLNVPGQNDGKLKKFLRTLKWMTITIFFPEFILAHAFFELVLAVKGTEIIAERSEANIIKFPWLIRQLFSKASRKQPQDAEAAQTAGNIKQVDDNRGSKELLCNRKAADWTLTHSYFANMGGFYFEGDVSFPLTAMQYAQEIEHFKIPTVSEDDIADKSKQDFFAKAVALLQISQLVLSLIVRKIRNLPFSQLEILTLALAIFGIAIYIVYWYKPQGVGYPILIQKEDSTGTSKLSYRKTHDHFWEILTNTPSRSYQEKDSIERIANDNIPSEAASKTHVAIPTLAVLSAVFGCFHFMAWNFEFPTAVEQLLWRIATILSLAVPIISLAFIPLAQVTVSTNRTDEFMLGCIYLLHEMSWHCDDLSIHEDLCEAKFLLETIHADSEISPTASSSSGNATQKHYKEIFSGKISQPTFLDDMVKLLENECSEGIKKISPSFLSDFETLVSCLNGTGRKSIIENAKTNVFPWKNLLPREVNSFILYISGAIYFISRLMIISLAFSSLRAMEDGVYTTTWTANLPAIQ